MSEIFETEDPRMDFILANYSKVMDFEECLEYTKKNICNSLLKKFKKMLEAWGYEDLTITKNKYIIWAAQSYYDDDEDAGLYYSIEIEDGWDTLARKVHYPAFLALSAEKAEGKSKNSRKINAWIDDSAKIMGENKNKLSAKGIRIVTGAEDRGNVIAVIYLEELLLDSSSTIPLDDIEISVKKKVNLFVETLTGDKGLLKSFPDFEK